jgi:uncharacterized protein YecT (DUF1311 family)
MRKRSKGRCGNTGSTHLAALLIVPAGLFIACGSPAAAAPKLAAAYAACMAKANTTLDMKACQQAGLTEANARLAAAYAQALNVLPADQRVKLRAAQRLWIAFRASDCAVFFGSQTGTIAGVEAGSCLIDRTERRIENLKNLLPL